MNRRLEETMERLTKRNEHGDADIIVKNDRVGTEIRCLEKAINRLAAYEDTGLTPEDIDALQKRGQGLAEMLVNISCGCAVPYSRLAELAQAERDGWLTVLPPNDPLTLEELREMDGEPVWVEWGGHPQAGWALVRVWSKANNTVYLTYHNRNTDLLGFVLNDGGNIYRRKPEEGHT